MNEEIAINEFYLLVNKSGYILKTKSKEDFEEVKEWGYILFAGKVKTSQFLHFKVGSIWHKKKVILIPTSKPQTETHFYDVNELDLKNGNTISQVKFGGKETPVTYESL